MMRGWRIAAVVVAAALFGAAAALGGWHWYRNSAAWERPLFSLPDLDGERRSIAEWDGQIIVLNFWATWCAPCREEMPLFTELQRTYGDRGVQFLGVAVDRVDKVRQFMDAFDINYPSLHGIGAAMEVAALYGNEAGTLPYTVVIDRDGFIRHIFTRQVHRAELEPILKEMTG